MTLTWHVRVTVERIVDGDTFVGRFDLGWGVWRLETAGAPARVRLLGYSAPERGEEYYAEAADALARVVPPGTRVWVVSARLDSFGRALCDVFLEDGRNLLDLLPQQWRTT